MEIGNIGTAVIYGDEDTDEYRHYAMCIPASWDGQKFDGERWIIPYEYGFPIVGRNASEFKNPFFIPCASQEASNVPVETLSHYATGTVVVDADNVPYTLIPLDYEGYEVGWFSGRKIFTEEDMLIKGMLTEIVRG